MDQKRLQHDITSESGTMKRLAGDSAVRSIFKTNSNGTTCKQKRAYGKQASSDQCIKENYVLLNEFQNKNWNTGLAAEASPAQPAIEKKAGPEKKHTSKQQASIDKQASIGYNRI